VVKKVQHSQAGKLPFASLSILRTEELRNDHDGGHVSLADIASELFGISSKSVSVFPDRLAYK
jgi:hypothetical protein